MLKTSPDGLRLGVVNKKEQINSTVSPWSKKRYLEFS
jgi:hypothetical protein